MVIIDGNSFIEFEKNRVRPLIEKQDTIIQILDNDIKGLKDRLELVEGQLTKLQEKSVTSSTNVKSRQAF